MTEVKTKTVTTDLLDALRALTPDDRALVANVVGDYNRNVDEDEGDNAEARRRAYKALGAFVRAGRETHDPERDAA
jgi:hypothetical protein